MITKNQSIGKKITDGYYKTSLSKDKGIYAICWKKDFDAMVRRGYLEIGVGDAGMKKEEQGDIDSRLNQHCTSKNVFDDLVEIGRWTDLKKINRDHDIFDNVGLIAPRREGLNKAGGRHKYELFRLPVAEAMIKAYDRSGEYDSIKLIAKKALSKIIKDKEKITKIDLIKFRDIQIKVIDQILKKLKSQGFNMSVVAELCPRIGKTIIFLELFKRINAVNPKFKTMIIQVYGVGLSIFKSYNDEVSKWKDFIDMDIIDSSDDDAEQKFKLSQKQGRLQVVLVGLNPDESSRRYQWINQYTGSVVSLLEEADFGCHTDQQVKKTEFLNANKKNIVRINASGTNIGRLAKAMGGNEISEIIVVPYSEVENDRDSSKNGIVKRRYYNAIFDPKVNQMLEGYDPEALPSIKKILERPWEQEAWLGAVWGDIVGSPTARMRYGMNINQMANEDLKYIMAFQTGTKKSMDQHKEVIEKYCPEHYVLALHGDVAGMNNKTAEQRTKEKIVELKHGMIPGKNKLIVLTNMMGSRSYTVGEISAVLFMQDRGDIDTFIQKSSRVLSPYPAKKFGHIFDFAFDPNKTRNTEMAIVNDAVVTQDIHGGSFPKAIRQVLSCVNLYDMGKGGWQSDNQLVASLEDNNKLLELANCSNKIDIKKIDKKLLDILLKMNNTYDEKEKKKMKQIITGKTYKNGGGVNKGDIDFVLSRVKKAINSLNNSATSVVWFANKIGDTFLECINEIDLHEEAKLDFEKVFGISPIDIKHLAPILPINIYDICVKNSRDGQGQKYATNKELGILGQGDSKELWNDIMSNAILDARIKYVLKNNGKILIVAGGQGIEVDVLVEKYGKGIVKHLWFNDTIISFTNEAKDKYNKINVIKGDFLGLNIDMKFDVIVGNPPYQDPVNSTTKLWNRFLERAIDYCKDDGIVGFITPSVWLIRPTGQASKNITENILSKYQLIEVNTRAGDYFPVGEQICSYIIQKTDKKSKTRFILQDNEADIMYNGQAIPISEKDKIKISIFDKLESYSCNLKEVTYNDLGSGTDTEKLPTTKKNNDVPVYWTAAEINKYYYNKEKIKKGPKIILNRSGYYYSEKYPDKYIKLDMKEEYAVGVGAFGISIKDKAEGNILKKLLISKLYRWYVENEKSGGYNTGINKLPLLSLDSEWSDKKLYREFGLNNKEVKFVEDYFKSN